MQSYTRIHCMSHHCKGHNCANPQPAQSLQWASQSVEITSSYAGALGFFFLVHFNSTSKHSILLSLTRR